MTTRSKMGLKEKSYMKLVTSANPFQKKLLFATRGKDLKNNLEQNSGSVIHVMRHIRKG